MKILYITTVAITMGFFPEHIKMLLKEGHTVDVASNCTDYKLPEYCKELGLKVYNIPFSRSPLSSSNIKAYKEIKKLIKYGDYDIVHTHTPNASICARLACRNMRKHGLKVIYTAHGFHFYKGAPFINWLLYYPIEWLCSFLTDTIVTINQEDYLLAEKHFHSKKVYRIPGIGLDIKKLERTDFSVCEYRKSLGLSDNDFMILSVGEVNANKNHELVIRAAAELKNPEIHYFIAGVGDRTNEYELMADRLGIADNIHLLGYRDDIAELNLSADLFAFPSIREGLGMSSLEAMACGTPVCGMNTRGINEYVIEGKTGFLFENNIISCAEAIEKMVNMSPNSLTQMAENCKNKATEYETGKTNKILQEVYKETFYI